jgi:flagellar biosynthesis protein FlhG
METLDLFRDNGGGEKRKACEVWAVGGGKGGTGKSLITSSLGFTLAKKGKRVIMIDADLGGPNLHTFLGITKPGGSLSEFFDNKVPLQELVTESGHSNMRLIGGDLTTLDSNNIKHTQKLKLFRHIRALDTDYTLIDLGSGAHHNIVDTFLLADKMVVVIVPEITAVENMYHFVKNVFFRKLKMSLRQGNFKELAQSAWKNRKNLGFSDLRGLFSYLKQEYPQLGELLDKEIGEFRINIVMNQIRSPQEIQIGISLKSVLYKCFGFDTNYSGYVEYDDTIYRTTNKRMPFVLTYPLSNCTREIGDLADNLINGKQVRVLTA